LAKAGAGRFALYYPGHVRLPEGSEAGIPMPFHFLQKPSNVPDPSVRISFCKKDFFCGFNDCLDGERIALRRQTC
jgi:hypothetical protein